MRTIRFASTLFLLVSCAAWGGGTMALSSPGFPPSEVDETGAVHEPWGVAALRLTVPAGAELRSQHYDETSAPTVTTTYAADGVVLEQKAYRAPVWPSGVDVLEACLRNTTEEKRAIELEFVLPVDIGFGERIGTIGGRQAVALPNAIEPQRNARSWGAVQPGSALPGWGRPSAECAPAFKNIRAGMGGVKLAYRFSVVPGEGRTVALGLCESYWAESGKRPMTLRVEGAPARTVDPVAEWGQHGAGCIFFKAVDLNGDGAIDVAVEPHPSAQDKNPILNVLWVFPEGMAMDPEQVTAGAMNDHAEHYVDVGGETDQMFYEGGSLRYALELAPGAEEELLFLLGSPGSSGVPDPGTMAWTPSSLRKAAEDVWRDR